MAEGAALEMLYTLIAYRGFESLPLLQKRKHTERCVFFFYTIEGIRRKKPAACGRYELLRFNVNHGERVNRSHPFNRPLQIQQFLYIINRKDKMKTY